MPRRGESDLARSSWFGGFTLPAAEGGGRWRRPILCRSPPPDPGDLRALPPFADVGSREVVYRETAIGFSMSMENNMAANARVKGKVEYRAGDGPLISIPHGLLEVQLGADSAVLSWGEGPAAQTAAIPLDEFQRYLDKGLIEKD